MSAERVFLEAMSQLKQDLVEHNRRNEALNHNLGLIYQGIVGLRDELARFNKHAERKGMKGVLREGRKLTEVLGDVLGGLE